MLSVRFATIDGVEMVFLQADASTTIVRPATDDDRARWPTEYALAHPAAGA